MGTRVFYCPLVGISVTNDSTQDIWQLAAGSTKPVTLHAFSLTSTTTTDERVQLSLVRYATAGSGGSAATEVAADDDETTTIVGAVTTLNTTQGGTAEVIAGWNWSQQGELLYLPTPEMRPTAGATRFFGLSLATAVASTRTWSGYVCWSE